VTEVLRENAKTMDVLRKARSEQAQTMTAVEDFISYGEITDVRADGIKKFIRCFRLSTKACRMPRRRMRIRAFVESGDNGRHRGQQTRGSKQLFR
jgi:hypothetical protein